MKLPTTTAIFARNHFDYLEKAAKRERPVTFRARSKWVSALRALEQFRTVPIYFAVIDGGPQVEFTGLLEDVLLDPSRSARKTKQLLAGCVEGTETEKLWDGSVRTLYVINACTRLQRPFPMGALKKISDGAPLSADFKYSYALVHEQA